jgi:hypothetical protein
MSPSNPDKPTPPQKEVGLTQTDEAREFSAVEEFRETDGRLQKLQAIGSSFLDSVFFRTVIALAEHTGSTAVAAICFWFAGAVIKGLVPEGWIRATIDTIEGIGLIVLVIWFFVQMFKQLYNATKGNRNGSHSILVA